MLVFQTQAEQQIAELIEQPLLAMGYHIVRIKMIQASKVKTLQIMIERTDNQPLGIIDCEKVNNQAATLLDVYDTIKEQYNLEISSPGINRPLTRYEDFTKYRGHKVKITTIKSINDRRNFTGNIVNIDKNIINIELEDAKNFVDIDIHNISEAHLKSDPFVNHKNKKVK